VSAPLLLELEGVSAGYDRAVVIEGVSLALRQGESLALLGRNGVGKSTLIATIMGATVLHGGRLRWRGGDLGRVPAHRRARLGLGWVAQERWIFPSLTVQENLTVAARSSARPGAWTLARVHQLFPRLEERRANLGWQLSGGEQQMLAIARALMLNPSLLLLDEPLEGLAPVIVEELAHAIRGMMETGDLAVILVEQHAAEALALTETAVVMDRGRVVLCDASTTLQQDPDRLNRLIGLGFSD
jgi:branched-chain amino acid transport system ATP-binding protein